MSTKIKTSVKQKIMKKLNYRIVKYMSGNGIKFVATAWNNKISLNSKIFSKKEEAKNDLQKIAKKLNYELNFFDGEYEYSKSLGLVKEGSLDGITSQGFAKNY